MFVFIPFKLLSFTKMQIETKYPKNICAKQNMALFHRLISHMIQPTVCVCPDENGNFPSFFIIVRYGYTFYVLFCRPVFWRSIKLNEFLDNKIFSQIAISKFSLSRPTHGMRSWHSTHTLTYMKRQLCNFTDHCVCIADYYLHCRSNE